MFLADGVREHAEAIYRAESRRVLATLIRLLGDFDLAEEALHEAFHAALEQWPRDGVPANPRTWLVSAGRFKGIDSIRRRARFHPLDESAEAVEAPGADPAVWGSRRPGTRPHKETVMRRQVKPIPDGMRTVTPHLVCEGAADAIEFYKKAFGAVEMSRLPGPDGKLMHAAIRIGDSAVMLVDDFPEYGSRGPKALRGSPVTIHLYVEDVDAVVSRAVAAGAKITMPLADQFWGDRYGQLEDPFGHRWSVATHVRDVSPEEWPAAMHNATR